MEEERMRLYLAWKDATEKYWQLLSGHGGLYPPKDSDVQDVIEEMDRTLDELMESYGHRRRGSERY